MSSFIQKHSSSIFPEIDLLKKHRFRFRRKTREPGERKTCRNKYELETKCMYCARTGDRTKAQWCKAPGKNLYATCFPLLYNCTIGQCVTYKNLCSYTGVVAFLLITITAKTHFLQTKSVKQYNITAVVPSKIQFMQI